MANVVVSFFLNDEPHVATLPRGAATKDLITTWKRLSGWQEQRFKLSIGDENDTIVPHEGTIGDLLKSSARMLEVTVTKLFGVNVVVLGAPNSVVNIEAHADMSVEEAVCSIVRRLDIEATRGARLMFNDKILVPSEKLSDQIDDHGLLLLDLEVTINTIQLQSKPFYPVIYIKRNKPLLNEDLPEDAQDKAAHPMAIPLYLKDLEVQTVRCFASQMCENLLPPEAALDTIRIVAKESRKIVRPPAQICDILEADDILKDRHVVAMIEKEVTVTIHNRVTGQRQRKKCWPSQPLRDLLSTAKGENIFSNGKKLPEQLTMWEAGIQLLVPSVTVTCSISLKIVGSSGKVFNIEADPQDSSYDLHQIIAPTEANDQFRFHFNGHKLPCDKHPLSEHGIGNNSRLYVTYKTRDIFLSLRGCAPQVVNVRNGTTCNSLRNITSKCFQRELPEDTWFKCSCGRIVSNDNPDRQTFPMKCCPNPFAVFTVMVPECQEAHGHTLSTTYRAPENDLMTTILKLIKELSDCNNKRKLQRTESMLVKRCLMLVEAEQIKTDCKERLDLAIKVQDDIETWPVWSCQSIFELLTEIELKKKCCIADFAIRGHQLLNVRANRSRTFKEEGLRDKQLITVLLEEPESHNPQTPVTSKPVETATDAPRERAEAAIDGPRERAEVAIDGPRERAQVAIDAPRERAEVAIDAPRERAEAGTDVPRERAEVAIDAPRQRAVQQIGETRERTVYPAADAAANFRIRWSDRNEQEYFDVAVPCESGELRVADLREAISRSRGVPASALVMKQFWMGRRQRDGATVVWTLDSSDKWIFATAAGEEVTLGDVEEEKWNVELQDMDVLITPRGLCSRIYVDVNVRRL